MAVHSSGYIARDDQESILRKSPLVKSTLLQTLTRPALEENPVKNLDRVPKVLNIYVRSVYSYCTCLRVLPFLWSVKRKREVGTFHMVHCCVCSKCSCGPHKSRREHLCIRMSRRTCLISLEADHVVVHSSGNTMCPMLGPQTCLRVTKHRDTSC